MTNDNLKTPNSSKLEKEVKKSFEIEIEITNDTLINVAGKLIGGYLLYECGKFIGGDYGAIVGAYVGLKCNYYQCKDAILETKFKKKIN